MSRIPWCKDCDGVVSVMTERELDYVESLWEAWKPDDAKYRFRFLTLARSKIAGLTWKAAFAAIGIRGQTWQWRSYLWSAKALCRARRQFWETGVLKEYEMERNTLNDQIIKNQRRIAICENQLLSWKVELKAQQEKLKRMV